MTGTKAPINYLCIDTCGPYLCVSLGSQKNHQSIVQPGQNRSSIDLVPTIKELLALMNLEKPDCIAVTVGPGSFTGTRIGVSTARNLGMLWNVPLRSFYSLQLYAESLMAGQPFPYLVALDGKQNRFYSILVDGEDRVYNTQLQDLQDLKPQEIQQLTGLEIPIFCDAFDLLKERLPEPGPVLSLPKPEPESFYRLLDRSAGQTQPYSSILPVYVRSDPATAKYPDGFQHKPDS
ncbi:MAG: tRNA (adenosine(37)-N6)-threonylcarbamoyltransferase complex dimerization subunit type 1 TsaB [Leptospiraceae bacterium]